METGSYERPLVAALRAALARTKGPALLQIVIGPRQVGKTTGALAVVDHWDGPTRYAAADEVLPPGAEWIRTQRELARRVENAVGAHIVSHLHDAADEVSYFRDGEDEVDFVLRRGRSVVGLEVKSGSPGKQSGVAAFVKKHPGARALLVGSGGVPLEDFFAEDPRTWLDAGSLRLDRQSRIS